MAGVTAEVRKVCSLANSVLTMDAWRAEVERQLGNPCTVIQANYSVRGTFGPVSAAIIDEIRASLQSQGIQLGGPLQPSVEIKQEPMPPCEPVEIIVEGSGERFIAPVANYWNLSTGVVIMLLYVQTPVQQLAHLAGRRILVRHLL